MISQNRFNGLAFALTIRKLLKPFEHQEATQITRLKPGENEIAAKVAGKKKKAASDGGLLNAFFEESGVKESCRGVKPIGR